MRRRKKQCWFGLFHLEISGRKCLALACWKHDSSLPEREGHLPIPPKKRLGA